MNSRLLAGLAIVAASALLVTGLSTTTALDVAGDGERIDRVRDLVGTGVASVANVVDEEPAIGYGMNGFYASDVESRSGADLAYGQIWVGKWVDKRGRLADFEDRVAQVREAGQTPVVEWWYFGDQISTKAVTKGLPDGRSVKKWHELGPQVAQAACRGAEGDLVFVIETEFNKGGVDTMESFDGELAKHVRLVKEACPTAVVAIGFGLWRSDEWARFDRAAAEADAIGLQLMRSLAKDSRAEYETGPASAVAGARKLADLFGKPILLHDVALSSYGKGGQKLQASALADLLDRREELQEAGVTMILYRSVRDTPSMAKGNYYGVGEAHWGLWTKSGVAKPAYDVWVDAIADVGL